MKRYNPKEIEPKWQQVWRETGIYKADMSRTDDKFYIVPMLPYPSGDLHIGHWYNFAPTDTVARFHRMLGQNVFQTVGFDAFGLPAENAAIKRNTQPAVWTYGNIETMTRQLEQIGASYDWDHSLATCKPDYYRWNQWLFLKLFEKGLAYRARRMVNWCPKDLTVLANEQVVGEENVCERCGTPVIQKELEQWFFKITDYAERLLEDLENVDWPEKVKTMQENWIGKSQGALVKFKVASKADYVLLHGFSGSPKTNFFPWLAKELGDKAYIPDLPNSSRPDAKEQAEFVLKNHKFSGDTVLLGHSYGSVSVLRILEQLDKPVKKTVLVAGFAQPGFPDRKRPFEETTDWNFDFKKIKQNAGELVILRASNDTAVVPERADYLQEKLGGRIVDFEASDNHVTGEIEPVVLENLGANIEVFTTRPDTIYGATYMVLAPEHPVVKQITSDECRERVENYIEETKRKTELERKEGEKHKTGTFTGAYAVNPATKKKIPIWIADYVLASYGTGAIMAVPAHDERDREFAQKFELPIQEVVANFHVYEDRHKAREGLETLRRHVVDAIITNGKGEYLLLFENDDYHFVGGGVDPEDKDDIEALKREIKEESGYIDIKSIREVSNTLSAHGYRATKNKNQIVDGKFYEVVLGSDKRVDSEAEAGEHQLKWVKKEEVANLLSWYGHQAGWEQYLNGVKHFDGEGMLINSGKYSGLSSAEARERIVSDLAKEGIAKEQTNYRLRDWLISRQRYWGTPIPIIYCDKCGIQTVPEKDLPVVLPEDVEFELTGRSPLMEREDFVNTKCPNCGGAAKRETDTMDTFVDSSWYYLRYLDNKNGQAAFDVDLINKWMPMDHYIGGIEHAILHLLYARFITKFLHDYHGLKFEEPFKKLTNQGIILGPDGQKMSKSKGNVVNPDEQVTSYGTDSLRLYLMFMGPYEQGGPYSMGGIAGTRRFLDRVWTLIGEFLESDSGPRSNIEETALVATTHRTIKKVTQDLEKLDFNTAIAAMMSLVNELYRFKAEDGVSQTPGWRQSLETLVQLLAPFAPHIAEELWHELGHEDSVHIGRWPEWDNSLVTDEMMTLAIQINGKVRAEITLLADISEEEILKLAKENEKIVALIDGQKIKKEIYVPGRLVSLVV
jgi:leucyl-tRNA synthetase